MMLNSLVHWAFNFFSIAIPLRLFGLICTDFVPLKHLTVFKHNFAARRKLDFAEQEYFTRLSERVCPNSRAMSAIQTVSGFSSSVCLCWRLAVIRPQCRNSESPTWTLCADQYRTSRFTAGQGEFVVACLSNGGRAIDAT
jgi:hypothetical protein